MSLIEYKPLKAVKNMEDAVALRTIEKLREKTIALFEAGKYEEAFQNTVENLHTLHTFSDYGDAEFRAAFITLLFDLAEINYALKDYKQSNKDLERIFRHLEPLLKADADRFGPYHVLAMELSTRILRSRKRMLELLARQQLHTGILYEKVNAGVAAATDKLVDALRKDAEMMASTGDYKGAVRFYMEAIKLSKKRTGRVTGREVLMTIDVAKLMMRSRQQTERARRLLNAVMAHAREEELKHQIETLLRVIDEKDNAESMWRSFLAKVQSATKFLKKDKDGKEEESED